MAERGRGGRSRSGWSLACVCWLPRSWKNGNPPSQQHRMRRLVAPVAAVCGGWISSGSNRSESAKFLLRAPKTVEISCPSRQFKPCYRCFPFLAGGLEAGCVCSSSEFVSVPFLIVDLSSPRPPRPEPIRRRLRPRRRRPRWMWRRLPFRVHLPAASLRSRSALVCTSLGLHWSTAGGLPLISLRAGWRTAKF